MGNRKFRLSDMMPNAWFYKLRDMSRTRKKPSSLSDPRNFYFSDTPPERPNRFHQKPSEARFQQNPPRNSFSSTRAKRKTVYKPSSSSSSLSAGCSCHATAHNHNISKTNLPSQDSLDCLFPALESSSESFPTSFEDEDDDFVPPMSFNDQLTPRSCSSDFKVSSSADDIIIDVNNDALRRKKFEEIDGFDAVSGPEFPPISTRTEKAGPTRNQTNDLKRSHLSVKVIKQKEKEEEDRVCRNRIQKKHPKPVSAGRKSSANSSGIKLRVNSPKIQVSARKSVSKSQSKEVLESFAVVKASVDPKKDFRESMLEMIVENNLRESKDLEDLLACYLSLNPKEYHNVIIKVFAQIWFESQSYIRNKVV